MSRKLTALLFSSMLLMYFFSTWGGVQKVSAVVGSDWRAGRIIDDGIFTDKDSMTVGQIQDFLNQKVGTGGYDSVPGRCDTSGLRSAEPFAGGTRAQYAASLGRPTTFTCLSNYYEVPKTSPGPEVPANNYGGKPIPAGAMSAAQLIWDAAQAYNISPKVLLVTIQKESAGPLTTDDWPFEKQYTYAMGAYCPDSREGPKCDPNYAGFSLQIRESAALFRWYLDNMDQPWWSYKKPYQVNNILWQTVYDGNGNLTNCGGSDVYIENRATAALYTYTPYQPNAAALANLYGTGDYCSAYGNRNFWRIYHDWFGMTTFASVFKGDQTPAVYVLISGRKYAIPSMALLQDFGYDPGRIQVINQDSVDATPNPPPGLSSQLGYLVKSPDDQDGDGGAAYVVSTGKKYAIPNMEQFNNYGFTPSNITYLPLDYIMAIKSGPSLTSFVQTPTMNVFNVSSAQKRIIFDYQTYRDLNPSDISNQVSDYFAGQLQSGIPIANQEVLVRISDGTVNMLSNGKYFTLPSYDVFDCWGFNASGSVAPLHTLALDSYIAPITSVGSMSCLTKADASTTYLMSGAKKYIIPSEFGSFGTQSQPEAITLAQKVTTNSSPLKQAIKSSSSATVWYIENGYKKAVPSLSNYSLLGLNSNLVDVLKESSVNALPANGIKLGTGQLVKSTDQSTVYVVDGNTKIPYTSGEDFEAFRNQWSSIESYEPNSLQPFTTNTQPIYRYLYDSSTSKVFLIDKQGCYALSDQLLEDLVQDKNAIITNQNFGVSIFKNVDLSKCANASSYFKTPTQPTVYYIENGTKHPISSWSALQAHSGQQNPTITGVSDSTIEPLATGSTL